MSLQRVASSSSLLLYWGKNFVFLNLSILFNVFLISISGNRKRARPKSIWFQINTIIWTIYLQESNVIMIAIIGLGDDSNFDKGFFSLVVIINNVVSLWLRVLNVNKASKVIYEPGIIVLNYILEIMVFRNMFWSELSNIIFWFLI